jgi:hypothetical protein
MIDIEKKTNGDRKIKFKFWVEKHLVRQYKNRKSKRVANYYEERPPRKG